MAKVSVVIPTYNCLDYLPKAIGSVLKQTHQDIELIIIDDNSNDGTSIYLASIHDDRIVKLSTLGVGAPQARNLGIEKATGEFIAFLDADDFWFPEKVERQLEFHQRYPDLAMSFTNYEHLTEDYQVIVDCFSYWSQFQGQDELFINIENPLEFLIENNVIGTSTVMVRADVFSQTGSFNADIKYGEDWELWLRMSENHQIGALNSVQVGYLMRASSVTQTENLKLRNLKSIETILQHYQDDSQRWNLPTSSFKIAKARILEGYADYYRGLQINRLAISYSVRSLVLAPQKRTFRHLLGDFKSFLLPAL
ncbi:teichuronic acid biosynthesis glycosyltransferase TuaG [Vibrio crassostreae]|uniref:glycosyltransferase family 2 protein n=1 Tax=Vibrio crassostreae TaxID=246167 RepID=UPI001B300379|nr:glycosyltransferase [Vibrio crassostreae]CAK2107714.1 teichuronic acid biosynthesis glycosyltransferase TuaG [Vibrio crassostreae]CAK2112323.1 teichuronic acid biosynthesis glycosyltransferase TuaG [Vibrio crassostreae]CAK2118532.1 teichuronic acid biosynthesis glycosyltransferase TuaG [Vibrio crassostreae]CAK2119163.1 teichuronic acid biosynthesis glycosyltransferase TuaG [Vibrio crassostreae]CAK2120066.1 teichuronic acid biosynthesis glycosyltransferase TuaG [Vibrio crassostreae]